MSPNMSQSTKTTNTQTSSILSYNPTKIKKSSVKEKKCDPPIYSSTVSNIPIIVHSFNNEDGTNDSFCHKRKYF